MTRSTTALFGLGQIVRHRDGGFRGVVIDVDPVYGGPPNEPGPLHADQPFYSVLAAGPDGGFIVYAAEAVLEHDPGADALTRTEEARWFTLDKRGHHAPKSQAIH